MCALKSKIIIRRKQKKTINRFDLSHAFSSKYPEFSYSSSSFPASCETSIHSVILGIFEQIQKHYETKEKQDILTLSTGYRELS